LPSTSEFRIDFQVTKKAGMEAGNGKKVTPTPAADPDPEELTA
jgi:hypothetical protein